MPNFYTHLRFAQEVADGLSPELKNRVKAEWDSYCCGNFGPDPLYFGRCREVGLRLHRGTGEAALERYREAISKDLPYGVSFATGYFLHYLLDSGMHPLVYRTMEETGCSHRQVEGELDRLLLEKDVKNYREAMPARPFSRSFLYMASKMAPEVMPELYEKGMKRFRFVSMKLCDWTGTPIRHVTNAASRLTHIQGLQGAVLDKTAEAQMEAHLTKMLEAYQDILEAAPELVGDFLKSARDGTALPDILRKDFSGNQVI